MFSILGEPLAPFVTFDAFIRAFFEATKETFGGIDIAVNMVGIVLKRPFLDTTEPGYDTMFGINFQSSLFFYSGSGQTLERSRINDHLTSLAG